MKNINKIKSYYGLAVRARKVAFGVNEILEKHAQTVLVCSSISENSLNKLKNHQTNNNAKLFILDASEMQEITSNSKILALGILDNGLAQAIKDNL